MVYPLKNDSKRFPDKTKDNEPSPATYKSIEAYEFHSPTA
jgi:hypothetical protein